MNVFEAYEKQVRKDMTPAEEHDDKDKLFELEGEGTETHTEETNEQETTPPQLKLSDEDMDTLVSKVVAAIRGGE